MVHNSQAPMLFNASVSDGVWHFLCVSWYNVNTTVEVTLDAAKQQTLNIGYGSGNPDFGTALSTGGCITLGQHNAASDRNCTKYVSTYSYEGYLSEVTLWSRVLQASEVYQRAIRTRMHGLRVTAPSWLAMRALHITLLCC